MEPGVSVIALVSFGLGIAVTAYASWVAGRRGRQAMESPPPPPANSPATITGPIPDSPIPEHAQSDNWERFHLFDAEAPQPQRHEDQVYCHEAPLAMVCPECDLRQPALGLNWMSARRKCDYCGVILQVRGSRLYWWRRIGEGAVSDGDA
jgi:hypothetical protein